MSEHIQMCNDHARRITVVETKMEMLLPALEKVSDKLSELSSAVYDISNAASEQRGKVEAKFGTTDMLIMVVLGAVGSYFFGTMVA